MGNALWNFELKLKQTRAWRFDCGNLPWHASKGRRGPADKADFLFLNSLTFYRTQ
jgi:hypothetical protein